MKAAFIEQHAGPGVFRRVRRHLDRIAQLFEAGDAHKMSESRHFRGKLVFEVRRGARMSREA
jgi:hypothetical protein